MCNRPFMQNVRVTCYDKLDRFSLLRNEIPPSNALLCVFFRTVIPMGATVHETANLFPTAEYNELLLYREILV